MPGQVIEVKNLTKIFSYNKKEEGLKASFKSLFKRQKLQKLAVDNISFSIAPGEFVGFIGPNGAGKTTTLKMLSGILYPSSGKVVVGGHVPGEREDKFKRKISIVMGQKAQLWGTLSAGDSLVLLQKMYEISEVVYRQRLKQLTDMLDLADLLDVQVRKLSLGQRMKLELVAALIHEPSILFLDEPTIGLDVLAQKTIRKFLRDVNRRLKTTIILTSHYMEDVQDLCQRLIIINEGKIGYDGSLDKIIKDYSQEKILQIDFEKKVMRHRLEKIGQVNKYSSYSASISIPNDQFQSKLGWLVNSFPVKDLTISNLTLDQIISDIFKGK